MGVFVLVGEVGEFEIRTCPLYVNIWECVGVGWGGG